MERNNFEKLKELFDYAVKEKPIKNWGKYLFEFLGFKWHENNNFNITQKDTSVIAKFSIGKYNFILDYSEASEEDLAIQKQINAFYNNRDNINGSKYILILKNGKCYNKYITKDSESGILDSLHEFIIYKTIEDFYRLICAVLPDESMNKSEISKLLRDVKSIDKDPPCTN